MKRGADPATRAGQGSRAAGRVVEPAALDVLIASLKQRGYTVLGPRVRDGAIVYDAIECAADLPAGWTATQAPGSYRLSRREDGAIFGWAVGPESLKRWLHPPEVSAWRAVRGDDGVRIEAVAPASPRYAFVGVRPCDLHAAAIQDRVFLGGAVVDPVYQDRREGAFIVAVNCGEPGGTCFCASTGSGPSASSGFDLVMTELLDGGEHRFVIEAGSPGGADLLAALPGRAAGAEDVLAARAVTERAASRMGRSLDTAGLAEALAAAAEHPRWDRVAERCLACGNCTMVCPTCFCTTFEESSTLDGHGSERRRRWDSCFGLDFSYLHGGPVRASVRSRYRQWLSHKLGTWSAQFGTPGCVGCGRCIAWCPVGIDITEEAAAVRAQARPRSGHAAHAAGPGRTS